MIEADRIVDCAEHRTQLWMHADPVLMRHTVEAILDPLLREKPHSKVVLAETLQLWLESHASAPKIAGQRGA
ncbi:hypothetical protein [Aeromicrobium sp. UC242_57]|uniref:hypothetical protein n=1 Tax=Aeromicrobium sp. UC242_57 TaxID=3374624 RepID=UPI0037C0E593